MKTVFKALGIYFLFVLLPLFLALVVGILTSKTEVYDTTDLAEYGRIHGNGYKFDQLAQADLDAYFPAAIDPAWEDVRYHYHAENNTFWSRICYEIDLEFVIPDQAAFDAYVATVAPIEAFRPFPYDEAFLEYAHEDTYIRIDYEQDEQTGEKHAEYFDPVYIKETLIAPSERRVVIVAVRAEDASPVEAADWFFRRFDIDVTDYALDLQKIDPKRAFVNKAAP